MYRETMALLKIMKKSMDKVSSKNLQKTDPFVTFVKKIFNKKWMSVDSFLR